MSQQPVLESPRKRIWIQHVVVEADKLQIRLNAARTGQLTPWQDAIAVGVAEHISKARAAALREDPIPGRWANWWRGTLVEAAYQNLHAAQSGMVCLFELDDLSAELPLALARARSTFHRDDPRLAAAERLSAAVIEPHSVDPARTTLRAVVADSYERLDLEHTRLRSFRNIVLMCALTILLLVVGTVTVVILNPTWIPLCFPNEITTTEGVTKIQGQNCPTSEAGIGPRWSDIVVVALLGALAGTLAATLSIRKLRGTSTPYDVSVALACLKVPLGAFTAILALIAIQGAFIPGLTLLDSQDQILAYALVFGFAQQALTRALDKQALSLQEGLQGDLIADASRQTPGPQLSGGPG